VPADFSIVNSGDGGVAFPADYKKSAAPCEEFRSGVRSVSPRGRANGDCAKDAPFKSGGN
jgi:hypothetical protein